MTTKHLYIVMRLDKHLLWSCEQFQIDFRREVAAIHIDEVIVSS